MKVLLIALLAAISYAQTDCKFGKEERGYYDGTIISATIVNDASACQAKCCSNSDCKLWVFRHTGKASIFPDEMTNCHLKDDDELVFYKHSGHQTQRKIASTKSPTNVPTKNPTANPTNAPTKNPTATPTNVPTHEPSTYIYQSFPQIYGEPWCGSGYENVMSQGECEFAAQELGIGANASVDVFGGIPPCSYVFNGLRWNPWGVNETSTKNYLDYIAICRKADSNPGCVEPARSGVVNAKKIGLSESGIFPRDGQRVDMWNDVVSLISHFPGELSGGLLLSGNEQNKKISKGRISITHPVELYFLTGIDSSVDCGLSDFWKDSPEYEWVGEGHWTANDKSHTFEVHRRRFEQTGKIIIPSCNHGGAMAIVVYQC